MGKEDVEGEGVGGEVRAKLGRGRGRSDLRFSRWVWFRSSVSIVRPVLGFAPKAADVMQT
jgi:hypothetical protein